MNICKMLLLYICLRRSPSQWALQSPEREENGIAQVTSTTWHMVYRFQSVLPGELIRTCWDVCFLEILSVNEVNRGRHLSGVLTTISWTYSLSWAQGLVVYSQTPVCVFFWWRLLISWKMWLCIWTQLAFWKPRWCTEFKIGMDFKENSICILRFELQHTWQLGSLLTITMSSSEMKRLTYCEFKGNFTVILFKVLPHTDSIHKNKTTKWFWLWKKIWR